MKEVVGQMLAVDRRHQILERVADQQTIQVGELARALRVSEMTIRRDIHRLERDGFLRRTYGGATAHLTRALELAFNARALEHAAAKRRIGMEAARLVEGASTLFVGVGTTAEHFARFLPARDNIGQPAGDALRPGGGARWRGAARGARLLGSDRRRLGGSVPRRRRGDRRGRRFSSERHHRARGRCRRDQPADDGAQ
ncbi:MAG: DeoR/GlpR transcriptional regulator [Chloroflexi bacterium]|nr:MAG: DeoR/GlpR transcriptional regulator [Chloroflexota bacterium]